MKMINYSDFIKALNSKNIQTSMVTTPRGKGIELESTINGKVTKALLLYYSNNEYFTLEIAFEKVIDPEYYITTKLLLQDLSARLNHRFWRILDTGHIITQAHYFTDDVNDLIRFTLSKLKLIGEEFIIAIPTIDDVAQGRKSIPEARYAFRQLGLIK